MKYHFVLLFCLSVMPLFAFAEKGDAFAAYTWTSPSEDASESMPCGGGDIGLNVWVEQGDLLLYVSRSGAFDENNTLLKQGRLRLHLTPNPFEGNPEDFRQTLHLDKGFVEIAAGGVSIQVWTDVFSPTVHVETVSSRPVEAVLSYESWRYKDRLIRKGEGQQCSYKWAIPNGCITRADNVQANEQDLVFFHRNDVKTVFDVAVEQQGLESVKPQLVNPLANLTSGGWLMLPDFTFQGTSDGDYMGTDFKAWNYKTKTSRKKIDITLKLHIAQTPTIDEWKQKLFEKNKNNNAKAKQASRAWWVDYYRRSYIQADGEAAEMTRNYTLFRYMMGCNAYGAYPMKFNGGLFTFDPAAVDEKQAFTPDYRRWGGGTMTAQNQRLVYWGMMKSGDTDLLPSQLDTYLRMLPNAELRTRTYWGHNGACFSEQIENFGLPNPAEYGFKRPDYFDRGVEYNAWLEYEWDTVLEFCSMALLANRYSGMDIHRYEPLITSALTFFDAHYRYLAKHRGRKDLDGNGKLILFPGSACETYKMTLNSASTVSALHTVLTQYLYYQQKSGRPSDSCTVAMLKTIPDIPLRTVNGKTMIAPAESWERINNVETPQLYPVFPWRIYTAVNDTADVAKNTYWHDTDALRFRTHIGWKQDGIWAACLGLAGEAFRLNKAKLANGPHRFPAFWGPGYDWTPDHNWGGSGVIGLQEMLLQEDGTRILLFPAWQKSQNVRFKLHASQKTVVEAELQNGEARIISVQPESRRKDVVIMLK